MSDRTICAWLRHWAGTDAVFATVYARGAAETITFARLFDHALRYATLYTRNNVGRGDVVIIILKHSPQLFFSHLGAMLVGAVPSFMPFPSSKQRPEPYWRDHATLFERIEPAALVTYAENARAVARYLPSFAGSVIVAQEGNVADVPPADAASVDAIDADALACLQHSSGTTSLKKGVMLTHRAVLAAISSYAQAIGLRHDDRIASWLPLYHDMGFIACFLTSIAIGTHLVALDPFEWVVRPTSLLDAIERHRVTFCWLPNFAFSHLVNGAKADARWDLSSMRAFINCSEPCKAATFQRFLARFTECGVRAESLHVSYAMAENVFGVTQTALDRPVRTIHGDTDAFATGRIEPARPNSAVDRASPSCGRPIDGVRIAVKPHDVEDANHAVSERALPDGYVGEIHIASPFLFDGYDRLPRLTRRTRARRMVSDRRSGFRARRRALRHRAAGRPADLQRTQLPRARDRGDRERAPRGGAGSRGRPGGGGSTDGCVGRRRLGRDSLGLRHRSARKRGASRGARTARTRRSRRRAARRGRAREDDQREDQPRREQGALRERDAMTITDASLLEQTAAVIREHFRLDDATRIDGATSSADVAGWDSLSHTMLVMAIEERFGVELPTDRVFEAESVGALVALIAEAAR